MIVDQQKNKDNVIPFPAHPILSDYLKFVLELARLEQESQDLMYKDSAQIVGLSVPSGY